MKRIKTFLSVLLTLCLMLPACAAAEKALAAGKWVSAWTTSTVNSAVKISGLSLQDIIPVRSTIRTELTVSTGGSKLRFCFSNEYGTADITISEAAVAKTNTTGLAKIITDTSVPITFDGEKSVVVPRGETVWSDNVKFETTALEKISVSLFFEDMTYITSAGLSNGRTFLSPGTLMLGTASKVNYAALNASTEINISSGSITYHTIPFLCNIETFANSSDACTAVFIGDSTLVNDTYLNYALRAVNAGADNVSIVNQAVVGNKLLNNGTGLIGSLYGDALVNRFERDALNISGIKYIFVKIGLNDILHQYTKSMANSTPKVSAQDIINGYNELIARAHEKGIKIYFFSKSAWNGYERSFLGQTGDLTWNAEAQAMCDELDKWIKSDNGSDGYIDCSPLARPDDRTKLCPSFTPDGAHLNALGAVALADLIPLEYIGVNSAEAKTAAELLNTDPYAEKREIERTMNKTPSQTETTAPAEENTTVPGQEEPASEPSTTEPVTEAPATEAPTEPTSAAPSTTVPFIPATAAVQDVTLPYQPSETEPSSTIYNYNDLNYEAKDVNYKVNDEEPASIGTDLPIGFILVLFSSIVAASAIIILTIGKKKESF